MRAREAAEGCVCVCVGRGGLTLYHCDIPGVLDSVRSVTGGFVGCVKLASDYVGVKLLRK